MKMNYRIKTLLAALILLFAPNATILAQEASANVTVSMEPNGADQTASFSAENGTEMDEQANEEVADIYLNFKDASLSSIVNYLAEQKQINIIPHKNLDGLKVSLTTRTPLTLSRSWNILLTLLDMNGYTILNVNDIYRIVPIKQSGQEPLPMYSSAKGTEPENLPDSDDRIRYIYFFNNAKAGEMSQVLGKMLTDGNIKVNEDLEALIITDKSRSIKAAMEIVKRLDVGGLKQSIKITRLKYADANQIAALFDTILGNESQSNNVRIFTAAQKKKASYFAPTTKIIPDPVKNSLILLGSEENMNKIIMFIKKHLDRPPDVANSRLHVKEIKYASAERLKPILESMIRPPAGQKKEKSPLVGDFKFFEDVIIAAEAPGSGEDSLRGSGNRLIIACGKDDWKRLEKFIEDLDKPEPQVAMEVMIVDVTSNMRRELGTQLRNKPGWLGKGMDGMTQHLSTVDLSGGDEFISGFNLVGVATGAGEPGTYATIGNAEKGDVWGVIKSVLGSDATNIISQPYLVANNGESASVEVISNKRVSGRINDPSKAGGSRTRDIEDMQAKTLVNLTPRINHEGVVNLLIEIEIREFQELESQGGEPRTTNRTLTTQATMGTGQVLIIGGLSESNRVESHRKTPVLADIPLLGNLFRSKRKQSIKTNLYVFIRPSVIKPIFEGKPDEYTELKLAYAKYQVLGVDTYSKIKDPIQRWFFKPRKEPVKKRLADLAQGRFRPIDDFTQGKQQPKSVTISRDPFYKTEYEIKRMKSEKEKIRQRKALSILQKRKQPEPVEDTPTSGLDALHGHAMSKN